MELLFTKHIPFPQEAFLPPAIGVWKCPEVNGANQATSQVTVLAPSIPGSVCDLGQQLVVLTQLTLAKSPPSQEMLPVEQNRSKEWKDEEY